MVHFGRRTGGGIYPTQVTYIGARVRSEDALFDEFVRNNLFDLVSRYSDLYVYGVWVAFSSSTGVFTSMDCDYYCARFGRSISSRSSLWTNVEQIIGTARKTKAVVIWWSLCYGLTNRCNYGRTT